MLWNGEQACVQGLLLAIHGREPERNFHVYNSHPREPLQTHLESSFCLPLNSIYLLQLC